MDHGISHDNSNNNQILCPIKPIRCIVKLGLFNLPHPLSFNQSLLFLSPFLFHFILFFILIFIMFASILLIKLYANIQHFPYFPFNQLETLLDGFTQQDSRIVSSVSFVFQFLNRPPLAFFFLVFLRSMNCLLSITEGIASVLGFYNFLLTLY